MLVRSAHTAYTPRSPRRCWRVSTLSKEFYGNDEFPTLRASVRSPCGWSARRATPNHPQWYIDRFKAMEAEGNDMAGESRLVNALASRGAKILDAGSGPGRVGKQLHALGHR